MSPLEQNGPKPREAAESKWTGLGGGLVLKVTWLAQMPVYIQSSLHFSESGGGLWKEITCILPRTESKRGKIPMRENAVNWLHICHQRHKLISHELLISVRDKALLSTLIL